MNKIEWYFNRFKTMSLAEVAFRIGESAKKKMEKGRSVLIDHSRQDYKGIFNGLKSNPYEDIPRELGREFRYYQDFEFFGLSVDILKEIDWQLDIISNKRFPLSFAKDIDIRSGASGSAKVVWEINRLQFLLPLALKYNFTRDKADLANFVRLLKSWILENPYLQGVNWYSNIEVNIRLIVWYFCWQVMFQVSELRNDDTFNEFAEKVWLPSIYEHCVYSYGNPSKYSSANNHLISEYSGLFVASAFWPFKEAEKWKIYAKEGLEKEIKLQHSKNGVNKEEAAEYIQFITDFFIIPFSAGKKFNIEFSAVYKEYLFRIINYINNLLDKNGNYCKYGDEDDGKVIITSIDNHYNNFLSILTSGSVIFNSSEFKAAGSGYDVKNFLLWGNKGLEVFSTIEPVPALKGSFFLKDEGHFIFRKQHQDSEIYMHFDVAPLGFLSIAAHGHADALSFCLNVDGHPFITDAGTYTYHTAAEWRKYFVSTLAHNTICVDGGNQAYQAGPTMWLKHFKSEVVDIVQNDAVESITGKNDGFRDTGCLHERKISFNRLKDLFEIDDHIAVNRGKHLLQMPFHLHPDVSIERQNGNEWVLVNKHCSRKIKVQFDQKFTVSVFQGEVSPVVGWFSPSFLIKQPSITLLGELNTDRSLDFKTVVEVI